MPTNTPNLGIQKPLGNEAFSREAINDNYDIIDAAAAKTAAANKLIQRDSSGHAKVAPPAAADDIAIKSTVTNAITDGMKRQAIINGGFAINQRGKSGTVVLTSGQYGHDRWKAGTSGCTYTFATSANETTITITAGSLVQSIEGINLLSSTYTLSWFGTALGKIGAGSYGASGIIGSVVGGTNISVEFNVGTLRNVQFNYGFDALPFQPRSFAEEMSLCQRYFQKSFAYSVAPVQNVGGSDTSPVALQGVNAGVVNFAVFQHYFTVVMRVAPALTLYNPNATNAQIRNFVTNTDFAGSQASNATESRFRISGTAPAASSTSDTVGVHWTADAEI